MAMGESPEIELVRRAWDALIAGGPEGLGEVLAPNVQWYGVEDGQLCDGRKAILGLEPSRETRLVLRSLLAQD